jgi:hypothetical protein
MLHRAYLIENGHVWTAVDLPCSGDEDAKKQIESLLDGRDIELWQRDPQGCSSSSFGGQVAHPGTACCTE